MMLEWELMNDWFLGRICFHRVFARTGSDGYTPGSCCANSGPIPARTALAIALRELGKLERTLFLLEYIRDVELRRRIHIGLNKGEARNALARGMFFNRLGNWATAHWKTSNIGPVLKFGRGSNRTLEHGLPGAGYSSAPQPRADDP
jgi:hypothetical protein